MPKERAHRLFSQLSTDLAKFTSDFPAQILCPLCFTAFREEAIDPDEPELTEEHIIPSELGGTIVTLTCKHCNNTHGSELDAHLIQMLRTQDSLCGTGTWPFKGRLEIGGKTVPSDVEWRVGSGEMTTFRLRQFDPAVHDAIREEMKSRSVDTFHVHLNFDYIPLRTYVAVLRIAYLALFRAWGYRCVLSPAMGVIREIIANFENAPHHLGELVGEVNNMAPAPEEPLQLFQYANGTVIMVVITLVAATKHRYVTFMPNPDTPPAAVLTALLSAAQRARKQFGNRALRNEQRVPPAES